MIDVIIPAKDESRTIGAVVREARAAKCCARVIVIDDGSSDDTKHVAVANGAVVARLRENRGKGRAMRLGLALSSTPFIAYLDADLRGFKSSHLDSLFSKLVTEHLSMVCGLRDYNAVTNAFQFTSLAETITGERIVARWLLDSIPNAYWSGYAIEAAINGYAKKLGAKTGKLVMTGVTIRNKTEKQGAFAGVKSHIKMFGEVGRTIAEMKKL